MYLDLSHMIEDGLVTYKGLPAPIICDYLSREESRKMVENNTFDPNVIQFVHSHFN
jgi:arylformamidase